MSPVRSGDPRAHLRFTRLAVCVATGAALVLTATSCRSGTSYGGAVAEPKPVIRTTITPPVRPSVSVARHAPHHEEVRKEPVALADAVAYAHAHGVRIGIAVADLDTGRIRSAGDPGFFGTGSVIKAMVASEMLLSGAMTGAEERTAYEMIVGSNDDACTRLWTRYGGPRIITSLGEHYGKTFGSPNVRPGFWGNTQVTASGLADFYLAVAHDPQVWPWLRAAMANSKRFADDGTDQYFGIPDAGGGHTVKQGWGTASSGDGYSPDASVNSTGIVTVGGHRYAVVLLSEGHGNERDADAHGLVRGQAAVVTSVAQIVLAALAN